MERLNRILEHPMYLSYLSQIQEYEKDRAFCRHDREHFLAVARIAMLLNLEGNFKIEKELIYTAAFLHDIGRFLEYSEGTPHHQASVMLAEQILKECCFDKEEKDRILEVILYHSNSNVKEELSFRGIFYRADKLSRTCCFCNATKDCEWDKKNEGIIW